MNPDTLTGLYGNESTPTPSGLASPEQDMGGASFGGGLDLGVNPARKRRSATQNALLALADIFNISASRPNLFGQTAVEPGSAYLGQSEERANALQKIRMEEDPEGRQIDLNRAKVLSQRAYNETDEVKKAIYGREIKKLLPEETQGLDDLTAADMFTSNEKIELEKYKQAGRMQIQEAKNRGAYDVATLKIMSAEQINREKLNAQWDIAKLKAEYNKAIQEGKNDTALIIQEMITDRQYDLHMMDNAAKLKQTEMQQAGANFRTVTQQEGQTTRTLAQNASREEIARMQADTELAKIAGRQKVAEINAEVRKATASTAAAKVEAQKQADIANWSNIEVQHNAQNARFEEALSLMSQYDMFGPVAGILSNLGLRSSEVLEAQGRVKGILTDAVEKRLQMVRQAAGSAKAADSEKEGARLLGYLTGDETIPQDKIVGALKAFMEKTDEALRLRKQELFGGVKKKQGFTIKQVK